MILVARHFATLTIVLAITVPAAAQDWKGMGRMEGKVTDASGAPLAGASVRLELPERGGGTTVTTDAKGRWVLGGIAAGTWHIDFALAGYAGRKVSVNLPAESSRLKPIEVTLEKAAATGPDPSTRQAFERAEAAYAEGRFAEARAEYGRLLALRPDLAPRIHQQMGFAYIREKQPGKAVEELEQVLAAEPDNAQVRAIAAQAALEGGMADKGRALLAALPEDAIREPDAFYNIAVNFVNAGLAEDGVLYFTKAIALDHAYVDGYYQRALAYLRLGRTAECRADFEKVVALAPEGPQAGLARKALEQVR
ncbi:MAG TPA: tetratricopeptide repeat protein [Vicinamibacteria bacterium]